MNFISKLSVLLPAIIGLAVTGVITTCSADKKGGPAIDDSTTTQLKAIRRNIREWALVDDGTAAKRHHDGVSYDTGDAVLFNGLLCTSGEAAACDSVRRSQSTTGQWFRSPSQVDTFDQNSFSRDMSLGVLAYLYTSRDKNAATNWLLYLSANDYQLCPNDTDGRCSISPTIWGLMAAVWRELDLPLINKMKYGTIGDESAITAQAIAAPLGYALHLQSVQVYLRDIISGTKLPAARSVLFDRDPDNIWFAYLRMQGGDIRPIADKIITDYYPRLDPNSKLNQWSFERDSKELAVLNSMGHEFIFLINLLIGAEK